MKPDINSLIYRIINGEEAAFRLLFDMYHQRLIHFAIYFLKSKELAEEAVADVFYNIWRKRELLKTIKDIEKYLYASVKNQSLHYLRRSHHIDKESVDVYEVEWIPISENPENDLLEKEYRELIQDAINSLPEKCKEVFRLVFSDELKHKDIAELLNISKKTVEAHIAKAYKRIASYINKEMLE